MPGKIKILAQFKKEKVRKVSKLIDNIAAEKGEVVDDDGSPSNKWAKLAKLASADKKPKLQPFKNLLEKLDDKEAPPLIPGELNFIQFKGNSLSDKQNVIKQTVDAMLEDEGIYWKLKD